MVSFLALSFCLVLLLTPQRAKVFRVPAFRENPVFILHLGCALGSTFCPLYPRKSLKHTRNPGFAKIFQGRSWFWHFQSSWSHCTLEVGIYFTFTQAQCSKKIFKVSFLVFRLFYLVGLFTVSNLLCCWKKRFPTIDNFLF